LLVASHIASVDVRMEENVTARILARITEGASRVRFGDGRVVEER
jgi:hypothetical protein